MGECSGVTLEEARKYARSDGRELNMVFQFEHMDVDADGSNKWTDRRFDLRDLKAILTKWQNGLDTVAWNSLFWENHDQPRSVSRFGDDGPYREASAKMLATCLHFMQGTPYIYQGEELGMTNAPFRDISDFRDLDSINAYHELTGQGIFTKEEMLCRLRKKSRDNARTPFQWSDDANAGFTTGKPWIMVNPNYREINAREQLAREDSVFHYYQKLIRLRKSLPVMVYGNYDLLLPEDPDLYIYTRTLDEEALLVICNFSSKPRAFSLPEGWRPGEMEPVIGNYPDPSADLRPYEAIVYRKSKGESLCL